MTHAGPDGAHGNHAGRPTAAELERRKRKVIDVATALFVGNGYSATSLTDIAHGAGVGTRTLYQHFGDKEAMFRDVILARVDDGFGIVPLVTANDDTASVLKMAARHLYDGLLGSRLSALMRLLIAESARFPDLTHAAVSGIMMRLQDDLAQLFRLAVQRHAMPCCDPRRTATMFADLMLGTAAIVVFASPTAARPSHAVIIEKIQIFRRGYLDWQGDIEPTGDALPFTAHDPRPTKEATHATQ